jgi:hypothetical protein
MSHGYDKNKFLNWVDKYSKFLDKRKREIHEILDSWTEPEVDVPTNGAAPAAASTANNTTTQTNSDSDDFDSVFGTEGEESDTDLFGTAATTTQTAAKVSAADALNRIKSFDFSL